MGSRIWTLLDGATATGAGAAKASRRGKCTFQAKGTTSAGTGAATVKVQASNDNTNWIDILTISLTLGTSETSDGGATDAAWAYHRGYVSAISGTGAVVSLVRAD